MTPHGPPTADPARTCPENPDRAASPQRDGPRSRARLRSVDVARGLAVVGMLFVDNRGPGISPQLVHVPWDGLHVADVVFPVFLLIVGVSLPFSSRARRPRAVLGRVARLLALGLLIITAKYGWIGLSTGVLGHIAGAYLLCWLLIRLPERLQIPVAAGVLVGMSVFYVLATEPAAGGALQPGSSWLGWLGAAPGESIGAEGPHAYLPSAVTVFLGVVAGRALRDRPGVGAVRRLVTAASVLAAAGGALSLVVPLNKHLWSASYVLLTGGIGLVVLAALHWLVDLRGITGPVRFAEILGLNAIVAFAVSELLFRAVLGRGAQQVLIGRLSAVIGDVAAAYAYPACTVLTIGALCWLLACRKIVVRI